VDGAEADGLELAQDTGDFAGFATEEPLAGEAGADPIGQEADAHVVDDALGLAMEDGADLEVALEFAKGFFDFERVFVMALDLRGVGPVDGEICVEEIPFVVDGHCCENLDMAACAGFIGFGECMGLALPAVCSGHPAGRIDGDLELLPAPVGLDIQDWVDEIAGCSGFVDLALSLVRI